MFVVNETEDINITCRASGLPAPEIMLSHNINTSRVMADSPDQILQPSGLYEVTRTFTVVATEDGDSGSLSCVAQSMIPDVNATDPVFSDTVNFQLVVQSKEESLVVFLC